MSKHEISPVKDNYEKLLTYSKLLARYNTAMKYQFYFEAMMIDYAMLEDRLLSFLYHAGVIAKRSSDKVTKSKKVRPYLNYLNKRYNGEDKNLVVSKISGKINLIEAILDWVINEVGVIEDSIYLKTLKTQCESLDLGLLKECLTEIKRWTNYRNEVIHAALNKNIDSLYAEIEQEAHNGMDLARIIDSQVRLLKKGNRIRRKLNLGNEW